MADDGQALFDFCAECLGRFIQDHYGDDNGNVILEENIPLGFTFSYPCLFVQSFSPDTLYSAETPVHRQESIDHGVLIRWTKGFGAGNVEGRDVAAMFKDSLKKHVSPPRRIERVVRTHTMRCRMYRSISSP